MSMSKNFGLLSNTWNNTSNRSIRARFGLILFTLVFIFSLVGMTPTSVLAAGTTYYVDKTVACSDSNAGTESCRAILYHWQGGNCGTGWGYGASRGWQLRRNRERYPLRYSWQPDHFFGCAGCHRDREWNCNRQCIPNHCPELHRC